VVVGYKYDGVTEGNVPYSIGFQPSGARGTLFANHCSVQSHFSDVSISQEINVFFVTICPHTYDKYNSFSATLNCPIRLVIRTVYILT
jgi:hypothetical protein